MLLDSFMPTWDIVMRHEVVVRAAAERAYQTARGADLMGDPITRLLFALRGLGGRGAFGLDDAPRWGFVVLGEDPGREFVVGTIGRFWRMVPDRVGPDPDAFRSLSLAGRAKAAANVRVEPIDAGRSRVITETRVLCADRATRWKFRLYWALIGPFAALIRRLMLARIKADAERTSL